MTDTAHEPQPSGDRTESIADRSQATGVAPLSLPSWLPVLLLLLVGTLVYAGSFQGVFLFDDLRNIVNNEGIRSLPPNAELGAEGLDRRWVGQWTFALNYALHGDQRFGYHAVNLLVHLGAGLFLYGLIRRTLLLPAAGARTASDARWLALSVALLWLVHPLQTQSVTYVVQRVEALMGLFFLALLYCLVRAATSPRRAWGIAAILATVLGMGSKEVMIVAPLVALLFDRIFLAESWRAVLGRRAWLHAGLWLAAVGLGIGLAPSFAAQDNPGAGLGYAAISPLEYFMSQPGVILHYLRLAVWPDALCLDYHWPIARRPLDVILPGLLLVLPFLAGLLLTLRKSPVGFLLLSFFLILGPTSSFIPIADLAFEHRMYLPLAPLLCLAVLGVERVVRWRLPVPWQARVVLASGVGLLVIGWGLRTVQRQSDYGSARAMWSSVVATAPHNYRALFNLGAACHEEGDIEAETRWYKRAIQTYPPHPQAHLCLANRLLEQQQFAKAAVHFRRVLVSKPFHPDATVNLAWARECQGQVERAVEVYRRALAIDSRSVLAVRGLARCYSMQGKHPQAVAEFQRAIRLAPRDPTLRVSLGNHYARCGQFPAAKDQYVQALRIDPRNQPAQHYLKLAQQRLAEQSS